MRDHGAIGARCGVVETVGAVAGGVADGAGTTGVGGGSIDGAGTALRAGSVVQAASVAIAHASALVRNNARRLTRPAPGTRPCADAARRIVRRGPAHRAARRRS